jgi:hypothetical protein
MTVQDVNWRLSHRPTFTLLGGTRDNATRSVPKRVLYLVRSVLPPPKLPGQNTIIGT